MINLNQHVDDCQSDPFPALHSFFIQLAPVLLSAKPSILIPVTGASPGKSGLILENGIRNLKTTFPIIFEMDVYRFGHRKLFLFFHPQRIGQILSRSENMDFLQTLGYRPGLNFRGYLDRFGTRFLTSFPHEIGIFLGIPVSDVRSFIQNRGKNYLFNKYWKVYHNPDQARATFEAYDSAKAEMAEMLSR